MKVKSLLKRFGNIRVHVHGPIWGDSVVCDSTEIKDTLMKDRIVKRVHIKNFNVYHEGFNDYFIVQGLDIEVK